MTIGGASAAGDTRLTPSSVKQFIASFPAVKTVVARKAKGKKIGTGKEALAAVAEASQDQDIKQDIDAATRSHGFRDSKEWFGVAKSVAVTYAYLKLSPEDAKNLRKLEKTIAKIEKNDLLTDKAKRSLIDALRGNAGALLEKPPQENVEAVLPVVAAIDALVK